MPLRTLYQSFGALTRPGTYMGENRRTFGDAMNAVPTHWFLTHRHEVPLPPLEGEVPNEREAEGFVRQPSV